MDCLAFGGVDIWFNSNDHLPPHFHAETADWHIVVNFLRDEGEMVKVKRGLGPSAKRKKEITAAAKDRRTALLAEWSSKVKANGPGPKE